MKTITTLFIALFAPFILFGQSTHIINSPCNLSVSIDSIVVRPCFRIGSNNAVNGGSCGCSNTLWAIADGGTAPYTYAWTTLGGSVWGTSDTIHGACYELWMVKVKDSNGCIDSASLNVIIPSTDTSSSTAGINKYNNTHSLKLYPVPASNQLNVSLVVPANNTHIEVYDMLGDKLLEQNINDGATLFTLDVSTFASNKYLLRIVGNNGQKTAKFSIDK
ncbi:MAG TPA: T9SS type A sorting domain-containing protein [Bacteroidia bacterium]